MRRTTRKKHTLRGLRVETLERRNLLAFGGLRMFLSYSDNAEPTNLATETKTTVPAIVATRAPIQTPVVVQSFVPVSLPTVLAPPASVPAEAESTTVPAIQVPAAASQLSVLAETTMPNTVSALDTPVVEAVDSSVVTGASLRSLITTPSNATSVAVHNDVPADDVLSSLSDSVEVENIAEPIKTDSIATQSNASVDTMGESESFIDTFAVPSVGLAYLPQTTIQLSSGTEETSLADLDNGIGGTDGSLESSNGSNENNSVQVTGNSIDDTNRTDVYESFIDDGSASDLENGFDDSNSVFDSGNDGDDVAFVGSNGLDGSVLGDERSESRANNELGELDSVSIGDLDSGFDDSRGVLDGDHDRDDNGVLGSVEPISFNIDNHVVDPSGVTDFENSLESESVGNLDNGFDDSNGVFESNKDGNDIALIGNDSLSGVDLDNRLGESSASNELVGLDFGSIGDLDNGFDDIGGVLDGDHDGDDVLASNREALSGIDLDIGIHDSSSVNELEKANNPLSTIVSGLSSATVNYGTWSANLVGSGTGNVVYQREGYESELSARVFGATPNATLDVVVGGVLVGQIRTNGTGSGRLKLENDDGRSLPVGFPVIGPTVTVNVGSSISGVFEQISNGAHD